MFGHRSGKDISFVLTGTVLVCLTLICFSTFTLWAIQTERSSISDHINNLADIGASSFAASLSKSDFQAIKAIAFAITETPEVEKVELIDPSGDVEFMAQDADASDHQLSSLSRPLLNTDNGGEPIGSLRLYFINQQAAGIAVWLASLAIFSAIVFLVCAGWRSWRASPRKNTIEQTFTIYPSDAKQTAERTAPKASLSTNLDHPPSLSGQGFETEIFGLLTADVRFADVSNGWLEFTGYRRDEVQGQELTAFLDLADTEMIKKRVATQLSDGRPQKGLLKVLRADQTIADLWFSAKAVSTPDGEKFSLIHGQDISELICDHGDKTAAEFSDHLTGLMNGIGFEKLLANLIANSTPPCKIACLVVDIDRFKTINDHYGQNTGEEVLSALVKRWSAALQKTTLSARLGRDEFAIAVVGENLLIEAEAIAKELQQATHEPFVIGSATFPISVSIGIAHLTENETDSQSLIHMAAVASSSCKEDGGDGVRTFEPSMLASRKKRTETEADIQRGIAEGLFEPHFQPITHLASGKIVGFEALMRLRHPEKGLIHPADFIPVAEETKTISQAGRQLFPKVLEGLKALNQRRGEDKLHISVNLSPVELTTDNITFMVDTLKTQQVDPTRLTVEITEAVFLQDSDQIADCLAMLQSVGCRIALDDFGTGYSSLSYLTRFHVDSIKIDQTFTKGLTDEDSVIRFRSRRLIEGIAAIAMKMDCSIVGEGVEQQEQAAAVHAIGVEFGQGYLFSKPVPLREALELV